MNTKWLVGPINRILGVVAGAVFIGSLALPWRHHVITGNRTGLDLLPLPWNDEEFTRLKLKMTLRPANDGRWLWFLVVAVLVLTIALVVRHRLIATLVGIAALGFMFLVRRVLEAHFVREFGEDSLGRFSERESWSEVGVGFYVAFGAVAVSICVALCGALAHFVMNRSNRSA
jgi:hypothetical protein